MFRESSELSLTRQAAGVLAPWVRFVVAAACVVTFAAVTIGSNLLWDQLPSWIDLGLFRHGLTFFITFWVIVTYMPQWPLSRALRVAVLLPVAHLVMIACAWPVWRLVSPHVLDAEATTTLASQFPIGIAAAGAALVFATVGVVVARRRSGEWVHAFAMLALAELLLLGLWLPIACAVWPGGSAEWWSTHEPLLANAGPRITFAIVPPTLAAIAFTVLAVRMPRTLAAWRPMIGYTVVAVGIVAVILRADASGRVLLLYSNFLPVLLAAAIVAIAALVALGGVTWWHSWAMSRAFSRSERRSGRIVDDGDQPVIGLEITSWLRGPRVVQRPFAVATVQGTLPVHGAHLVAATPPATTQLATGEAIAVLCPGDDVLLAGLSDGRGDPFRTSAVPLADALYVAPAALERSGFASAALVMWRPCVAYLLIVTAISLPALAALLST